MTELSEQERKIALRINARADRIIGDVWAEMEAERQRAELERVKADPKKNRTALIMANGKRADWFYFEAGKTKGEQVRFAYTKHRNAAGYFLFWHERKHIKTKRIRRDQWAARKTKKECIALARRRAGQWRAGERE